VKKKKDLILSIFQISVGLLAIIVFAIAGLGGESVARWTITLLLALAFVALGIIGVIDYKKKK
jgi:hypothetical protein